jgi:hypothetical protein
LLPSQNPSAQHVGYLLCPNTLGELQTQVGTAPPPPGIPWTWSIEAGHLWLRTYTYTGFGAQAHCDTADPSCTVTRMREWVPVSLDGNRVYVIERRYERLGGVGAPVLTNEYPNFFEREELASLARCETLPTH